MGRNMNRSTICSNRTGSWKSSATCCGRCGCRTALLLQTRGCDGVSNAWSNADSVTVCYEFIDDIWKNAPQQTTPAGIAPIDTLIGPLADVFLHEAGHATFQALKIPLFGREEDAADQFSTYIMLKFSKEEARRLVLGSAYQYKGDISSPAVTMTRQQFADDHGTPAQRFFNLLCMAYGADAKLFADVVEKGFLPRDRAEGCETEFAQVSHAFSALIGPYVDQAPCVEAAPEMVALGHHETAALAGIVTIH